MSQTCGDISHAFLEEHPLACHQRSTGLQDMVFRFYVDLISPCLMCISARACLTSWFAALAKVHTHQFCLQRTRRAAGWERADRDQSQGHRGPTAYSSAQIRSSSLPQSAHVPALPLTSSRLSAPLSEAMERVLFWRYSPHTSRHVETLVMVE